MARKLHAAVILALISLLVGVIPVSAASPVVVQHTKFFRFTNPDGSVVPGFPTVRGSASILIRRSDEVWTKAVTKDLPAGAYTVWWVIFNDPDACSPPGCGEDDVLPPPGNTDAGVSVLWATGGIVGRSGVGHFNAKLEAGDPPGQVLWGPGLTNPLRAEIHVILRYHGPVASDPALRHAQLTTFGGGCNNSPPELGMPGDFACYEPQAAVHPAP